MPRPPLGLQTIVFGKAYSIEDPAVLDHVAACGYAAVEAGCSDPAAFRRMLDERGMAYGGAHTGMAGLADVSPIIEKLGILGSRDLCNSALRYWNRRSLEDYQEGIEILNRAGAELRRAGIRLHYHNHDFEFEEVADGKTGMDLLLEGMDPDAVDLCVDVGWVTKAGLDPVEFLLAHEDRAGYLHFKDFNADGWIELGQGCVNFPGIMAILPELSGVRWVMVEQDTTRIDPLDSVSVSREYLKQAFDY